jgi:hypothetical protein
MTVEPKPQIPLEVPANKDEGIAAPGALDALIHPETPEASPVEGAVPVAAPEEKPEDKPQVPEPKKEEPWFVPGKYRTQEDAIKNQDKALGGLAKTIDDVKKTLEKIAANERREPEPTPADGGKTQAEIAAEWDELFATEPRKAAELWYQMKENQRKKNESAEIGNTKAAIKQEIIGEITWNDFIRLNPEMANPDNVAQMREVFETFPKLGKQSDGLVIARDIILSEGETLEDKYAAYVVKKKSVPQKETPITPAPPPVPGQGAIARPSIKKLEDSWSLFEPALHAG